MTFHLILKVQGPKLQSFLKVKVTLTLGTDFSKLFIYWHTHIILQIKACEPIWYALNRLNLKESEKYLKNASFRDPKLPPLQLR